MKNFNLIYFAAGLNRFIFDGIFIRAGAYRGTGVIAYFNGIKAQHY
jgi:hypothetical protein